MAQNQKISKAALRLLITLYITSHAFRERLINSQKCFWLFWHCFHEDEKSMGKVAQWSLDSRWLTAPKRFEIMKAEIQQQTVFRRQKHGRFDPTSQQATSTAIIIKFVDFSLEFVFHNFGIDKISTWFQLVPKIFFQKRFAGAVQSSKIREQLLALLVLNIIAK